MILWWYVLLSYIGSKLIEFPHVHLQPVYSNRINKFVMRVQVESIDFVKRVFVLKAGRRVCIEQNFVFSVTCFVLILFLSSMGTVFYRLFLDNFRRVVNYRNSRGYQIGS